MNYSEYIFLFVIVASLLAMPVNAERTPIGSVQINSIGVDIEITKDGTNLHIAENAKILFLNTTNSRVLKYYPLPQKEIYISPIQVIDLTKNTDNEYIRHFDIASLNGTECDGKFSIEDMNENRSRVIVCFNPNATQINTEIRTLIANDHQECISGGLYIQNVSFSYNHFGYIVPFTFSLSVSEDLYVNMSSVNCPTTNPIRQSSGYICKEILDIEEGMTRTVEFHGAAVDRVILEEQQEREQRQNDRFFQIGLVLVTVILTAITTFLITRHFYKKEK